MKYIDAEKLIAFKEALADIIISSQGLCTYDACKERAEQDTPILLATISSLQQEQPNEQPEYGYLFNKYIQGKKPRWDVGDVLAYYICTSNEEGECIIGKIVNVEFDEEGWIYTFEDEGASDEQSLVEQEVYKKN